MQLAVVIPTFNAPPERLARAVASARACPEVVGIVVVDDGSQRPVDAAAFEAPGAAVRVVRQSNAGPSVARNRGIHAANPGADGLMFLDDDDELIPAGVGALVGLVARLGAAAGIAAKVHVLSGGTEQRRPVPPEWADRALPSPGDVFRPLALFSTSGVLATRRAIDAGVRFDPALWHGEDRVFLRACAEVGSIAVSAEAAVRFAIHGGGASNLSSARHLRGRIRDHVAVMDRYLDGASEANFREATRWLLGAASKAGVDRESWRALADAAARRGWAVPVKCRVRRLIRRPTGRGGAA